MELEIVDKQAKQDGWDCGVKYICDWQGKKYYKVKKSDRSLPFYYIYEDGKVRGTSPAETFAFRGYYYNRHNS